MFNIVKNKSKKSNFKKVDKDNTMNEMIFDYKLSKITEPFTNRLQLLSGLGISLIVIAAFYAPDHPMKEFVISVLTFTFLFIEKTYTSAVNDLVTGKRSLKQSLIIYLVLVFVFPFLILGSYLSHMNKITNELSLESVGALLIVTLISTAFGSLLFLIPTIIKLQKSKLLDN